MDGTTELRAWLELDSDGIVHAGEHIRGVLNITSTVSSVSLLLVTTQLKGTFSVSERYVSPGPLLELNSQLRYGAGTVYGGGSLFSALQRDSGTQQEFSIFSAPPCCIATTEDLQEYVNYSYEWIMPLSTNVIPSYRSSTSTVEYKVIIGIQLTNNKTMIFERRITVLPAFNSQHTVEHPEVPLPFRFFDFCKAINLVSDISFSRMISPERSGGGSVWDRSYMNGVLPKLSDFKKYPRHPLKDRLFFDDPPPSQASMFNVVSLDSQPAVFTFRSGEDVVAKVRLGKTTLRLGEELSCLISFESRPWTSFQLTATLFCREIINESFSRTKNAQTLEIPHRRHEEACWMAKELSFSISLPSDANPTMFTNIFTTNWSIDFILVGWRSEDENVENTSTPSISSKVTPSGQENTIQEFSIPLTVVPNLAVSLALSRISNPVKHFTGDVQIMQIV